jgi:hypothetical protein
MGLLVLLRWQAAHRAGRVRAARAGGVLVALAAIIVALGIGSSARADESVSGATWLDPFYLGVRVGDMPVRLHSDNLNAGLAASGFAGVSANTDTSAVGESVYVGYEVAPHADVEFTYTHRDSHVATLSGAVASTASVPALLEDTAGLIRGYGNIFALSFRPRIELAPRLMLDPRIGAFVWSSKVTAVAAGSSFDETHQGGGITLGLGVAYRVWRGLELGVGADFYRGTPNNIATLYGGSLEWRFGR